LATAWEIVRGAARTNGGILFDTWHFFRGVPDLDLLAGVPGERIFSVQVSDGAPELRESLVKDTFRHRLLPGEGTFDLLGVLRVLRRTGGLNLVGPEVLSTELDALSAIEAARLAGEALDHVMADI
jgi:sugar phosphate isomerase/epimerase